VEETMSYKTDYLVGPGVIDFDLSIIDDPNKFKSYYILNDVNVLERFLVFREEAIKKAEKRKILSKQERSIINFIIEIDSNKPNRLIYQTQNGKMFYRTSILNILWLIYLDLISCQKMGEKSERRRV
jgi:hypothetical protein